MKTDILGSAINLPIVGITVLRDGYKYTVTEVFRHNDIGIVASITLKGPGGEVEVGYYDFLNHKPADA